MLNKKENKESLSIEKTKLLLVEGYDDEGFFKAYLEILALNNIQIINYNGKDNLYKRLNTLSKLDNFDELQTLIIQMDYDEGKNFKLVTDAFKKNKFTMPNNPFEYHSCKINNLKLAVIFTPPESLDNKKAELETLCLNIISQEEKYQTIYTLAKNYVTQVNNSYNTSHKLDKSILHAYLSVFCISKGQESYVGNRLNEVSKRGAWNFKSPHMDKYKTIFENS